jgi:hypothetical protein
VSWHQFHPAATVRRSAGPEVSAIISRLRESDNYYILDVRL